MIVLLLFSFAVLVGAMVYFFWERAAAYERDFATQLRIDLYRWFYQLDDKMLDRKNQILTSFEVPVHKLMISNEMKQNSKKYQATPYRVLESIFKEIRVLSLYHYNFIDLGCGAGRTLVLAHRYGFRKIIGVEADKNLARLCESNLKHYPPLYKIASIVNMPAENYEPPKGHSVIFLFNPFNEKVLEKILKTLAQKMEKKVLIYVNPVHENLILNAGSRVLIEKMHYHKDFSYKVYQLNEWTHQKSSDRSVSSPNISAKPELSL